MALPEPYARTIFGHAIFEAPTTHPYWSLRGTPTTGPYQTRCLHICFFSQKSATNLKRCPNYVAHDFLTTRNIIPPCRAFKTHTSTSK
jgi:hypothetical protein